ncbi:MAG: hypothetical protein V4441_04825 [Pseudomonadota bacterium]
MARGRIFSSRRMFSTRRDAFAEPSRNAGPMGVVLGLLAAGIIIFAIGVYIGATFPSTFGFGASAPAPVAATPPEVQAPAVSFAPETPSETPPEAPAQPAPDMEAPDAAPTAPAEAPSSVAPAAPAQTSPATPAPATP